MSLKIKKRPSQLTKEGWKRSSTKRLYSKDGYDYYEDNYEYWPLTFSLYVMIWIQFIDMWSTAMLADRYGWEYEQNSLVKGLIADNFFWFVGIKLLVSIGVFAVYAFVWRECEELRENPQWAMYIIWAYNLWALGVLTNHILILY